jgi:hypothetical protein
MTNSSGSHHELRKLHTRIDLIKEATLKVTTTDLRVNPLRRVTTQGTLSNMYLMSTFVWYLERRNLSLRKPERM